MENKTQEFMKKLKEVKLKVDTGYHRDVIQWSRSLQDEGFKYFSQNDEDGVIDAVFEYTGTTDKVYVEFGVESCKECNSRYLR